MFKNLKSKIQPKTAEPSPQIRAFKDGNVSVLEFDCIGLSYDALKSLGEKNPMYKKAKKSPDRHTEYEYHNFTNKPVSFDGYKVLINNVIVGYVPDACYKKFDDIMANKKVTSLYAKIYGGNYVIVNSEGVWKENDSLHCSVRIRYK